MTFKETILEEVLALFQREGIEANSEEELRNKLDISQATYNELFAGKEDLVRQTVLFDLDQQREKHQKLLKDVNNPIEEILILLQDGIQNMQKTNPQYVVDLQQNYPAVWEIALNHLNTYSYHEIYDILNRGVQEGVFRKDLNLQLVTKIILEMITLLLNPQIFPPERYNLAEVFRSIYLYYFRGLCTDNGAKNADTYFAKYNL